MFDGMGGPNGVMPADLMRLTKDQVEAWWLRPMAAARKQAAKDGSTAKPERAKPSELTMSELRAMMGSKHADKPPEWWQKQLDEYNRAARGAKNG